MQYGHGNAAWICSTGMDIICSMDTDMQHVHGHGQAARTWTCSMSLVVCSSPRYMDIVKYTLHVQVQVYAVCPCPCCMSKSAACLCPGCMPKLMLRVHVHAVWWHVHGAWKWTCSMFQYMLRVHVHAACPYPC
jgi:hypothetical protein